MTGLSAEVPSRQFCEQMSAVPALAEAFKDSALVWATMDTDGEWFVTTREGAPTVEDWPELSLVSAPTVGELCEWWFIESAKRDKRGLGRAGQAKLRCFGLGHRGALLEYHEKSSSGFGGLQSDQSDFTDADNLPDAIAEACLRAAKEQP